MQASFWECVRMANSLAFTEGRLRYFLTPPTGAFQPGDLAYVSGSINECFKELLQDRGYQLVPREDCEYMRRGRYCLVLRQLRGDRYLVCYLTTLGGARDPRDIASPPARYFALPLGVHDRWPGIPSLRTWPAWAPDAFIMGIPVARDGLQLSNLPGRFRLYPSEFERAKQLIRDKLAAFDYDCQSLREQNLHYLANLHKKNLNPDDDDDTEDCWIPAKQQVGIADSPTKRITDDDKVDAVPLTDDHIRHHRAFWLAPPMGHNSVVWLLRYAAEDIKSRSLYLNTINPKTAKQPLLTTLPKPFFAPSLRTNTTNIIRFVR